MKDIWRRRRWRGRENKWAVNIWIYNENVNEICNDNEWMWKWRNISERKSVEGNEFWKNEDLKREIMKSNRRKKEIWKSKWRKINERNIMKKARNMKSNWNES